MRKPGCIITCNRYYDPGTGRYLQTDPIGDGLNAYRYCNNNSISLGDPLGLIATKLSSKELNMRAMLSLIMSIEGGTGPNRYRMKNGGGILDNLDRHPGLFKVPARYKKGKKICEERNSSMAGAYQFKGSTWDMLAKKLGLTDFSEQSQDQAAIQNIIRVGGKGALDAAISGDVESFVNKLQREWTSLPGASQSHTSMEDANRQFENYKSRELEGNSLIATPQGKLFK